MKTTGVLSYKLRLLLVLILIIFSPHALLADHNSQPNDFDCMDKAIERIIEIRSLPEKRYLHTLDGQDVLLHEFYSKCQKLYPKCILFEKFYYLSNEIKEVASKTIEGKEKHKIRCYSNCLSAFCPEKHNPQKILGDIAEFYDGDGDFMGLSVYMGNGKYCPLPYDGYRK